MATWTQADVDALAAAIKRGVRSVTYATGSVTYHSLDDMLRLLEVMKADVGGTAAPQVTVGVYNSGLGGAALPHRGRRCP